MQKKKPKITSFITWILSFAVITTCMKNPLVIAQELNEMPESQEPQSIQSIFSEEEEESKPEETQSTQNTSSEEEDKTKPEETQSTESTSSEEEESKPEETQSTQNTSSEEEDKTKPEETQSTESTSNEEENKTEPEETQSTESTSSEEENKTEPEETQSTENTSSEEEEKSEPEETESVSDNDNNEDIETGFSAEVFQREGGSYIDGIVFSAGTINYKIKISGWENVEDIPKSSENISESSKDTESSNGTAENIESTSENPENNLGISSRSSESARNSQTVSLKYKIGEIEKIVPIENNIAQFTISVQENVLLQAWFVSQGTEKLILEENIILDNQAPTITYGKITKDQKKYAHITITEPGESPSGLKEWKFTINEGVVEPEQVKVITTYQLPNGKDVPVNQEIDIPMPLEGEELQVWVSDNAGNVTTRTISSTDVPDDVVRVVLPTNFTIAVRPYEEEENRQIYSDDVVICNQSEVPVNVSISSVGVMINHTVSEGDSAAEEILSQNQSIEAIKNCNVNLQLRQKEGETKLIPLNEGMNQNILNFPLAQKQEGTNPQELMKTRYSDTIHSSDYAIINLCGNLGDGSENLWRNGDLIVKLVFDIH